VASKPVAAEQASSERDLGHWVPSRWMSRRRLADAAPTALSSGAGIVGNGDSATVQRSETRVGYPSTRRLGHSVGFKRRRPPTGNVVSHRVHLKTRRLHRLGDEVSLYASLNRYS